MWTKDTMQALLNTNDLAVERGIVAIFKRQTPDEQAVNATKHDNKRGFRKNHDHTGSFFAKIIMSGWKKDGHRKRVHLNPVKLAKARGIILHYHRQLCEVANATELLAILSGNKA